MEIPLLPLFAESPSGPQSIHPLCAGWRPRASGPGFSAVPCWALRCPGGGAQGHHSPQIRVGTLFPNSAQAHVVLATGLLSACPCSRVTLAERPPGPPEPPPSGPSTEGGAAARAGTGAGDTVPASRARVDVGVLKRGAVGTGRGLEK